MDGYSGYNKIRLAPKIQKKTSFTTPWDTYCYVVIPFRLKNTSATYQRAMIDIFHDMMHVYMEAYVNDILLKSKTIGEHPGILAKVLQKAR